MEIINGGDPYWVNVYPKSIPTSSGDIVSLVQEKGKVGDEQREKLYNHPDLLVGALVQLGITRFLQGSTFDELTSSIGRTDQQAALFPKYIHHLNSLHPKHQGENERYGDTLLLHAVHAASRAVTQIKAKLPQNGFVHYYYPEFDIAPSARQQQEIEQLIMPFQETWVNGKKQYSEKEESLQIQADARVLGYSSCAELIADFLLHGRMAKLEQSEKFANLSQITIEDIMMNPEWYKETVLEKTNLLILLEDIMTYRYLNFFGSSEHVISHLPFSFEYFKTVLSNRARLDALVISVKEGSPAHTIMELIGSDLGVLANRSGSYGLLDPSSARKLYPAIKVLLSQALGKDPLAVISTFEGKAGVNKYVKENANGEYTSNPFSLDRPLATNIDYAGRQGYSGFQFIGPLFWREHPHLLELTDRTSKDWAAKMLHTYATFRPLFSHHHLVLIDWKIRDPRPKKNEKPFYGLPTDMYEFERPKTGIYSIPAQEYFRAMMRASTLALQQGQDGVKHQEYVVE